MAIQIVQKITQASENPVVFPFPGAGEVNYPVFPRPHHSEWFIEGPEDRLAIWFGASPVTSVLWHPNTT
jgi:hypothetical protein